MAKILKKIFDVIFVLMIVCLSLYFVLRFFGMAEIYRVQTGSMEDGIHAGDYILIYKKDKYNIGDVVTYEKEGYHVTHRIIKKNGDKVITKGDANNVEDDEINVKSIVGEVIYNGGILNFLIKYKYALASALLALYLFSCYFGRKEKESSFEEDIVQDEEENIDIKKIKKETKDDDLVKEDEETSGEEVALGEEEKSDLDDSKKGEIKEEENANKEETLKNGKDSELDVIENEKNTSKKNKNNTKSKSKTQEKKSLTKEKNTKQSGSGKKKTQSKKK